MRVYGWDGRPSQQKWIDARHLINSDSVAVLAYEQGRARNEEHGEAVGRYLVQLLLGLHAATNEHRSKRSWYQQ